VYIVLVWKYYVNETETELRKQNLFTAIVSTIVMLPIFLTLLLFAHIPNATYSLRFIPIFVLLVLISCVLCVLSVYRIVRRDQDNRSKSQLVALTCVNILFIILSITATLLVLLKLDDVIDWDWYLVLVPIWILNSIFLCVDILMLCQFVNTIRDAEVNHGTRGEHTAFLFLLNLIVCAVMISEILVAINDMRAIVRVIPILVYVVLERASPPLSLSLSDTHKHTDLILFFTFLWCSM